MFHLIKSLFRCAVVCVAALSFGGSVWAQEKAAPEDTNKPRLVVQSGNSAQSIAYSPNGKMIASSGNDTTINLWNVATGQLLRSLIGHRGWVRSVAFSPDGKILASGSYDTTINLWDVTTGQLLRTLTGHGGWVEATSFSPDGKTLVSGSGDKTIKLWDVATGKLLRTLTGHEGRVVTVTFSPDGKTLASGSGNKAIIMSSGSGDRTIKLWDVATGQLLRTITGIGHPVESVAFSPDGKTLAGGCTDRTIRLWDVNTGQILRTLTGHGNSVWSVAFSPDGKILASGSQDQRIILWDMATGQVLHTLLSSGLFSSGGAVNTIAFSPDGKIVASGSKGRTINLWNVSTGQLQSTLTGFDIIAQSVAFSPDGKILASGCGDRTIEGTKDKIIKLWDMTTGQPQRTLIGHKNLVASVAFSLDGKILASGSYDGTVKLWDVATGQMLHTLTGHEGWINSVALSPDGKTVASGSDDKTIKLWDVSTGGLLHTLAGHGFWVKSVAFSPDGKILASGSSYSGQVGEAATIKLWDVNTGQLLRTFTGVGSWISLLAFSPNGKTLVSGSGDKTAKLWDVTTGQFMRDLTEPEAWIISGAVSSDGKTLAIGGRDIKIWTASGQLQCSLYSDSDNAWTVVDPEGRYDGPNGGDVAGLHWVKGLTPIALNQFKDGFYEPGLLAKKLGFNKEPLRNVPLLADLKLFPETTIAPIANGKTATLNLTNQDGGLGAVQVFVNDKELLADARPQGFDASAKTATLTVSLDSPLVVPGKENKLRVVTRNSEGTLASRPVEATWTAPGAVEKREPELYAIVGGVSEYANPKAIKSLRFSAKDARDMATALKLGAEKLFNTKRVHLQLLTGESKPKTNVPRIAATKANFKTAFELVAQQAKPDDVVVVYLAGHGTTLGLGSSTYCYLTQDAAGTDFSDEKNRAAWTITSEELAEWTKKIPAQKQVLMLDTCAAGAAADDLTKRRDISGDQIRAMERLKDRVGFHVLMGSASDAVSYEAGRYNQGLLTYALLEGMKGRALREGKFVDVRTLFDYARDRVPQLAKNIGGIQQPQTASPKGDSFDVALVTDSEKKSIPLSIEQPQVLRPIVFDAGTDDNFDTLKFEPMLRESLIDAGSHSEQSTVGMVYIDRGELPGALRPMCSYKIKDDAVQVSIVFQRDGKNEGETLQVAGKKTQLELLSHQVAQTIRLAAAGKAGVRLVDATPVIENRGVVPSVEKPVPVAVKPATTPQIGEIALRGIVKSVDKKANRIVLQVRSFRLPSGKESSIAPKDKTILINAQTMWRGAMLNTLKVGANIEVIGTDGSKELTARLVLVR